MIRLLFLYPKAWRKESEEEFAEVVASHQLTFMLTGLYMASRKGGTFRRGLSGAMKTALIGYSWGVWEPARTPPAPNAASLVARMAAIVLAAVCGTAIRKYRGRVA